MPDAHPRHIAMQLRGGGQRRRRAARNASAAAKAATPTAAAAKKLMKQEVEWVRSGLKNNTKSGSEDKGSAVRGVGGRFAWLMFNQ